MLVLQRENLNYGAMMAKYIILLSPNLRSQA